MSKVTRRVKMPWFDFFEIWYPEISYFLLTSQSNTCYAGSMKDNPTNTPNTALSKVIMVREYACNTGSYVQTNLVVLGPNGKTAVVENLKPSVIGRLTKAGIKKI